MSTQIKTQDIADASVTNAKVASGLDASKLTTGNLPAAQAPLVDQAGFTNLVTTADQDVTNNTNVDSTILQFATIAGHRYMVDALMPFGGSDTTGDAAFRFAVAAGTMDGKGGASSVGASDTLANSILSAVGATSTATIPVGTVADASIPICTRAHFSFKASNSTVFSVQFGNNAAASGRVSRLMKGALLRYKDIS